MKEQQLHHLLDTLAEELVPAEADLWPAIRMRYATGNPQPQKGRILMKADYAHPARRIAALASALAVILFAAFLAFTPQGRALAQGIIRFFIRAESDTQPLPTSTPLVWAAVTPGEPVPVPTFPPMAAFAADCGDYDAPKCSVEQIRRKVNFPVLELGSIPDGMQFIGATGGPDGIVLFYNNGSYTFGLSLTEQPWTGNSKPQLPEIGASAVVETVQIGDVSGEYVNGSWSLSLARGGPFAASTPEGIRRVWDPYAGIQTLVWVKDGVLFGLSSFDRDMDHALDKAGLIALAAGLTSKPVSAGIFPVQWTATPTPDLTLFDGNAYGLSVAQAEALAGFDVLEPERLPQIFFLAGASHQPDGNIVRILYLEPSPLPDLFGLRLSEQVVPTGANCSLCGISKGDYRDFLAAESGLVAGSKAVIETVQIGGFTGQYVEGMWVQMGSWGWWPYQEIKTLRWQANGVAFELYYQGFRINNEIPLDKAGLMAIAESIMG